MGNMDEHFTRSKQLSKMPKKRQLEEKQQQNTPEASPTASLAVENLKKALEKAKEKVEEQSSQIAELIKEKRQLHEQLNSMKTQTTESDSSSFQSSSSDSSQSLTDSPDSSSSDDGHKKRKKGKGEKKKIGKTQKKSKKKKGWKERGVCYRARDPDEVVWRYKAVLKHYKKNRSFTTAYKAVGVDRNTIVTMAPIAELAIIDPPKFEELASSFTCKYKLLDFARKCSSTLTDLNVQNKIDQYKSDLRLLPLMKRH